MTLALKDGGKKDPSSSEKVFTPRLGAPAARVVVFFAATLVASAIMSRARAQATFLASASPGPGRGPHSHPVVSHQQVHHHPRGIPPTSDLRWPAPRAAAGAPHPSSASSSASSSPSPSTSLSQSPPPLSFYSRLMPDALRHRREAKLREPAQCLRLSLSNASLDAACDAPDPADDCQLDYCERYSLKDVFPDLAALRQNRTRCRSELEKLLSDEADVRRRVSQFDALLHRYNCQSGYSVKWDCLNCSVSIPIA